jgi:hypothetical protein
LADLLHDHLLDLVEQVVAKSSERRGGTPLPKSNEAQVSADDSQDWRKIAMLWQNVSRNGLEERHEVQGPS